MDKLIALLNKHAESYDSDCTLYFGCYCGWNNGDEEHNEGYAEHVAEAMKPVLADIYAEAFAAGFDLAADDTGAWAQIQDYPEDIPSEYHNPFEESK